MNKIIPCELCDLPAEYTIQATEVAGIEYKGKVIYYCEKHFNNTVRFI